MNEEPEKTDKEPTDDTAETSPKETGQAGDDVETQHAASKEEEGASEEEEKPKEKEEKPSKKKEEEIQEVTTLHERTIAALSYFGFLAIIPFYLKKDSKFCRFHGKQGLTIAIIFFLAQFIAVLDLIMDLTLILQAIIALWMGFVALSGRWKKMPLVYKWSCQLEESLYLKTKEEEAEQLTLMPNQVKEEETK